MRAERMNLFVEGHQAQDVLDANIDWQVRILKRIRRLGPCWPTQNEQAHGQREFHELHRGSVLGRFTGTQNVFASREQSQSAATPISRWLPQSGREGYPSVDLFQITGECARVNGSSEVL